MPEDDIVSDNCEEKSADKERKTSQLVAMGIDKNKQTRITCNKTTNAYQTHIITLVKIFVFLCDKQHVSLPEFLPWTGVEIDRGSVL